MPTEFSAAFATLKPVLKGFADRLAVKVDTATEYTLVTKLPSPFPQHKGDPMYFGSVRMGKAYVSFHLMLLYMCSGLIKTLTPALKKRMQGKTCFNFQSDPEPELIAGLMRLTEAGFNEWSERRWV
jgi:hypothetical protein